MDGAFATQPYYPKTKHLPVGGPPEEEKEEKEETKETRETRETRRRKKGKEKAKGQKITPVKPESALKPRDINVQLGANIDKPSAEYSSSKLVDDARFTMTLPGEEEGSERTVNLSLVDLRENAAKAQNAYSNDKTPERADEATIWEQAHLAALVALRHKIAGVHGKRTGEALPKDQKAAWWDPATMTTVTSLVWFAFAVHAGLEIASLITQGSNGIDGTVTPPQNETAAWQVHLSEGSSASPQDISELSVTLIAELVALVITTPLLIQAFRNYFSPTPAARAFTEHLDRHVVDLKKDERRFEDRYRDEFKKRRDKHGCKTEALVLRTQDGSSAGESSSGNSSSEEV